MEKNKTLSRIAKKIQEVHKGNRKVFTVFLTAGYPSLDSTLPLVQMCSDEGVDILELGMPFSDPLADGPVIQASSQRALHNGVTLPWIFEQVHTIRKFSTLPLILMGYLNPILRYGVERFFQDASDVGIDGLILPEVPLEETPRFKPSANKYGLDFVLLVSPTTPKKRIIAIDNATDSFLYCVSSTGVTGHSASADQILTYVQTVKNLVHHPVLVGFGIKTAEQARSIASVADGVIVGSEFLKRIQHDGDFSSISPWLRAMRNAL